MSNPVPTNSIEIVGDEIPGKVRLTMRSSDGEWTTTYLDSAEVAAIHAALGAFVPGPEVRGYVVLTPGSPRSGGWLVGTFVHDEEATAVEAAAAMRPRIPEAHVGVVTALLALRAEGDATP